MPDNRDPILSRSPGTGGIRDGFGGQYGRQFNGRMLLSDILQGATIGSAGQLVDRGLLDNRIRDFSDKVTGATRARENSDYNSYMRGLMRDDPGNDSNLSRLAGLFNPSPSANTGPSTLDRIGNLLNPNVGVDDGGVRGLIDRLRGVFNRNAAGVVPQGTDQSEAVRGRSGQLSYEGARSIPLGGNTLDKRPVTLDNNALGGLKPAKELSAKPSGGGGGYASSGASGTGASGGAGIVRGGTGLRQWMTGGATRLNIT